MAHYLYNSCERFPVLE